MQIKTNDILPIFEVLNEFYKVYKNIINHYYNLFFRFYSRGDGKLYIISNNLDIKLIFDISSDNINVDKVYNIIEFYSILKSMSVYPEFEIDFDTNYIKFDDDAEFLLKEIPIDDVMKNQFFNIVKIKETNNKQDILISEDIIDDFKLIKKIIDLKNKNFPNYYYYNDDDMVFNLFDLYLRKFNISLNINGDILGLRFLSFLFDMKFDSELLYYTTPDKFVLQSNMFYLEGKKYVFDNIDKQKFINKYFETDLLNSFEVNLKLEFSNFIDVVLKVDKNGFVLFDNGTIRVQSNDDDFCAVFNSDFKGKFIVKTSILGKVFDFLLHNFNTIKDFSLTIGTSSDGVQWLKMSTNGIIILTEVVSDIDSINYDNEDDEDVFEEY